MRMTIFEEILVKAIRSGVVPARTQEARDWFRRKARRSQVETIPINEMKERKTKNIEIGEMYMFQYDPKWKKELPYYDKFPCIFLIEELGKGRFLGINLHYLYPKQRAVLMDALYKTATDKRYDQNTKLKISYGILKSASKYRFFRPCVKQYLLSHVRSPFIKIFSSEWDIGLFLPVEQFEKASNRKVWADSSKAIDKHAKSGRFKTNKEYEAARNRRRKAAQKKTPSP